MQNRLDQQSSQLYRLNSKIMLGLGLVLTIVLNILFYYDYQDEVQNRIGQINKQLSIQKKLLDEGMGLMFNSVYLQRSWLEDRLNHVPDYDSKDHVINRFQYDQGLNISSRDNSAPEDDTEYGNIFVRGNISDVDYQVKREIQAVEEIFNLQRFLKENSSFDTWSTFYTKDYIMIYPFGKSAENVEDERELFSAIEQSIEQIDIEKKKEVLEKGWETDIFYDHTGQMLMFSKNLPVSKKGKVVGIIAVNISAEDIQDYVKNSSELEVYISDSGNNLVYSNGRIEELQSLKEVFKQKYNLDTAETSFIKDDFVKTKGRYFFTTQLENSNWKLIYVVPEKQVETSVYNRYIIYALLNLVLILSIIAIVLLLSRYGKKASEIGLLKDEFLMTVSHDLKSPLSAIIGFSEMIRNKMEGVIFPAIKERNADVDKAMERIRRNSAIIEKEGERLTQLIDNLLDLSLLEHGEMYFNNEPQGVSKILKDSVQTVQPLAETKGLKIYIEVEPQIYNVLADRDKIIQVMMNLLTNAVKFTEAGHIKCSPKKDKGMVLFCVEDTGMGIAEKYRETLFDKFTRVQRDEVNSRGLKRGTGLGLAICKNIVEKQGGRIWFESEEGQGSRFFFTLPVCQ